MPTTPTTNIYQMNDEFNFKNINLFSPINISTGNHFIQLLLNDETPLYLQLPKCHIKQGFVKCGTGNGKKTIVDTKHYCDLVFLNNNEQFVRWIENLETYCQNIIFNNREKWFESNLEKEDIENTMTTILKSYKGKYYTLRVNVPSHIKIFNEHENEINTEVVFSSENFCFEKNVISIIEIKGIKCSSRHFQIEIEMKQMMIFNENDIFNKCLVGEGNGKKEFDLHSRTTICSEKEAINTKKEIEMHPQKTFTSNNESSFNKETNNLVENNNIPPFLNSSENTVNNNKTNTSQIIKDEINKKHLAMSSFFNKKNIKNVNMLFNEDVIAQTN
jgi:hypothetical protein